MKPDHRSDSHDESEIKLQRKQTLQLLRERKTSLDERASSLWEDLKNYYLTEHIASAGVDIEALDAEHQKEIRSRANTAFANFVRTELDKFVKECRSKGEIWIKDKYPFNKGWIVNDDRIKDRLKSYPKLLDVLNFIDNEGSHDNTIQDKDLRSYTKKNEKGMTEERLYSHVIVNQEFYDRAYRELGIKKPTMQKCLQRFSDAGIIEKKGHLQTHGRAMLYIDGYYHEVPNIGKKKERFLTQRKHRKMLREFSY